MIADHHAWWYFWDHTEWLAVVLVIVPASIGAWASVAAAKVAKQNRATMDTGNGKDIGETVHDIAQQQEIAAAIQHTNTREVVELAERMVRVEDKIDGWIGTSTMVHDAILSRLDRIEGKGE